MSGECDICGSYEHVEMGCENATPIEDGHLEKMQAVIDAAKELREKIESHNCGGFGGGCCFGEIYNEFSKIQTALKELE